MLLAHRGEWLQYDDQNSLEAIKRAGGNGHGVEIDVWRDSNFREDLKVGHEIGDSNLFLSEVFQIWEQFYDLPLALNIKSDGCGSIIKNLLGYHDQTNYFCFDMSMPELVTYEKLSIKIAYRVSELETFVPERHPVVWLDSFWSDWYLVLEKEYLSLLLERSWIVSPSLHKRNPKAVEETLVQYQHLGYCKDIR